MISLGDLLPLIDNDITIRLKLGGITEQYTNYYDKRDIPEKYLTQPVMKISCGDDLTNESFLFIRLPAIALLL